MKILVIYATAGAGHRRAAEAIYQGLKSSPQFQVTLADVLDHTNRFYKILYSGTYTFFISKIPPVWGILFQILDCRSLLPIINLFRRTFNAINARRFHHFLVKENFDYILSTHFFPNEVAAYLKRKGLIRSQIISVITDYDVHQIWLAEGIDYYCVACELTKRKLLQLGIKENYVVITGIPVDEKFIQPWNKAELRKKLGLKENIFTVLVATGSFGIGPIEEIINLSLPLGFQVIVVCGHNKVLYDRLSRSVRVGGKIYGLVKNMDELMAVSDMMITKPGGLSITEALVTGLPLIFFSAIPGQETNNIKILSQYGVGRSGSLEGIGNVLKSLGDSPSEYQNLKEKIKAIARPHAVKDIIALIQ